MTGVNLLFTEFSCEVGKAEAGEVVCRFPDAGCIVETWILLTRIDLFFTKISRKVRKAEAGEIVR